MGYHGTAVTFKEKRERGINSSQLLLDTGGCPDFEQQSSVLMGKGKADVQVTGYKQESGSLPDIFCPVSRNLTYLLV